MTARPDGLRDAEQAMKVPWMAVGYSEHGRKGDALLVLSRVWQEERGALSPSQSNGFLFIIDFYY